jgi:hypothetical protein
VGLCPLVCVLLFFIYPVEEIIICLVCFGVKVLRKGQVYIFLKVS